MKLSATAFTLFSVQITWLHLLIGCSVLLALYIVFGLIREKAPKISLMRALVDAMKTAFGHPGDTIRFFLTEICLMLICLAPMLLLVELPFWYPAALTGLCWLVLANPARVNAAAAMQDSLGEGSVFSARLADPSGSGRKAWHGFVRAILLGLWAVPLAIGLNYAYRLYKGEDDMDGFKLLQTVQDYGGGDVKDGIRYLALILGGLVLILLIGLAFHSGARHALALGNPGMVNGHHGKIVLGWFIGLVLFLVPLWVALIAVASQAMPLLNDPNGLLSGTVKIPRAKNMLGLLAAGCAMTIPLIPARSMMTAAMVHQLKEQEETEES